MDTPPCPTEVQEWQYKDRDSGDWRNSDIRAEGTECGGGGSQVGHTHFTLLSLTKVVFNLFYLDAIASLQLSMSIRPSVHITLLTFWHCHFSL